MPTMVRSTYHVDGAMLYVNGILTEEKKGETTRGKIEKLVSREVHFHHNNTALDSQVVTTTGKIGGGALMGAYALEQECKDQGTFLSRLLGIVGLVLTGAGMTDYVDIQEQKNIHARQLAQKIVDHCTAHPYSPFNLVLHSQGADVGLRALRMLDKSFRDRTRVVTLGGMVGIPKGLCQYAINFTLNIDPVPNVVGNSLNFISKIVHGEVVRTCQIWSDASVFAHAIDDYLAHPAVQGVLKCLVKPDRFEVEQGRIVEHWNPSMKLLKWERKLRA